MKRADVAGKLPAERENLRERYAVASLALFCSVPRDDAGPHSDVALPVELGRPIPDEVQARYSEVPWSLMQGMRHILVQDYYAVKLDIVWRTIQQSLPPLVEPLRDILKENP